jgi:hypothetical protein
VRNPIAPKLEPNPKKTHKSLALIHMDNARVHTARVTQGKPDVSRLTHTPQPPDSPDIAPSNFFSVGLKLSLNAENITGKYAALIVLIGKMIGQSTPQFRKI